MQKINRQKIKIKNLIGIVDDPVEEDLLFEIVDFLESESRLDGVFKKAEVDLPQPEGPISAVTVLAGMSRSTSWRACISP